MLASQRSLSRHPQPSFQHAGVNAAKVHRHLRLAILQIAQAREGVFNPLRYIHRAKDTAEFPEGLE